MTILEIISHCDYMKVPFTLEQNSSKPNGFILIWQDRRRVIHYTNVQKRKLEREVKNYYNFTDKELKEFVLKRLKNIDVYGEYKTEV